jgi:hypothetical protein
MTPEVKILLINALGLALAYGLICPRLLPLTLKKIMIADAAMTGLLMAIAGALFWGTQMWLLGWHVGPIMFALITLLILEFPLFFWFSKKHNITF